VLRRNAKVYDKIHNLENDLRPDDPEQSAIRDADGEIEVLVTVPFQVARGNDLAARTFEVRIDGIRRKQARERFADHVSSAVDGASGVKSSQSRVNMHR
jgi:hypothetical protein